MFFDEDEENAENEKLAAETGGDAAEGDVEWKEVTLWIPITGQTMTCPVKTTDTVTDAKRNIAEMYGVDKETIRLGVAAGAYVQYFDDNDILTQVNNINQICVKGIYDFNNKRVVYPHPYCVIGGGHCGCRQAVEYKRRKIDFTLFERKDQFGGNAWATIANTQSRLQSEGLSYQLGYDPFDGGADAIWVNHFYSGDPHNHWPSKKRICENYHEYMIRYNIPFMLNTNVNFMDIIPEGPDQDFRHKSYDMHWYNMKNNEEKGVYKVSCMSCYPGAMCWTRRHEFPGEKAFVAAGGVVGYGVSNEFPYEKIEGKVGVIIGMGAFFAENVRTCCEYKSKKLWGVCRHYNLMCPRVCSWTMSINYAPSQAAEILDMMQPMYKCAGIQDPWDWWSINTKNAERTRATIKQYTRWGVGDIYFLALHYGRLEMINTEVKHFSPGKAHLKTGRVLEIDYLNKVLGFLSDFTMDKLMKCEKMLGQWPDGDWRRWIWSDQSEIDANRFSSLGMSCGAASFVRQSLWYHEHPMDAIRMLEDNVLIENYAEPELGLTAYHYHPRKGTTNMMNFGKYSPTLDSFNIENDLLRVEIYRKICSPALFQEGCARDWKKYCDLFAECGDTIDPPPYPFTVEMLEKVVENGEDTEQHYLHYKCHKTYGKELLGYVSEVEAPIR